MNREKAVRKAFYEALNNRISCPVFDAKTEGKPSIYVLFERQSASDSGDFRINRWNGQINFSIVHRQADSYTKDIVDNICEEIENIIKPGKASETVVFNISDWQITNVRLDNLDYADFQISDTETLCIKFLTFNFTITKI